MPGYVQFNKNTYTQLPPLLYSWSPLWISSHSTLSSFHLSVVHAFGDAISGEPLPELQFDRTQSICRSPTNTRLPVANLPLLSAVAAPISRILLSFRTEAVATNSAHLAPRLPSICSASAVRVVQKMAFMLLHVFQITHVHVRLVDRPLYGI